MLSTTLFIGINKFFLKNQFKLKKKVKNVVDFFVKTLKIIKLRRFCISYLILLFTPTRNVLNKNCNYKTFWKSIKYST